MSEKAKYTIGQFLVKNNFMTVEQIESVLIEQKKNPGKKFGFIALKLGFIDNDAINAFIKYMDS